MDAKQVLNTEKFNDNGISYELRVCVSVEATQEEYTWLEFDFVGKYPLKERLIMCKYHQMTEDERKTYTYTEEEANVLFDKLSDQIGESYYD